LRALVAVPAMLPLETVLADLTPATLARQARQLETDAAKLRRRAGELLVRERRAAALARVAAPQLTHREAERLARLVRDREIMRQALAGRSNAEIAKKTGLGRQWVGRIVQRQLRAAARGEGDDSPGPGVPSKALPRPGHSAGRLSVTIQAGNRPPAKIEKNGEISESDETSRFNCDVSQLGGTQP
jgi:hypothetical protein